MKRGILFLISAFCIILNSLTQDFDKDIFETPAGKDLTIYFIKHSSLIFEYDGKLIYVDAISEYMDPAIQPKADVILITHEHADHFDPEAISQLKKENTKIILNDASRQLLKEGESMKNGEKLQATSYLHLEAFPAYNITSGREIYHPRGRDNGYILTLGGLRIYVAGDTEDIPEMKELEEIDIAFLPVNQPYTMTVEQAVNAAKLIHPKILYPYHYNDSKVEEIAIALEDDPETEVRIRQLQ